jgi:hypothetical protein
MLQMQTESATLWLVLGKPARAMMDASDALPNEIDALRALILAERVAHASMIAERDKLAIRNERLEAIIDEIRRAHFGRKSERITDDQLALALDDLETSLAKMQAEEEKADPALKAAAARKAPRQPQRESRSPAARGGGDRAGEQGLPLMWRRVARHR